MSLQSLDWQKKMATCIVLVVTGYHSKTVIEHLSPSFLEGWKSAWQPVVNQNAHSHSQPPPDRYPLPPSQPLPAPPYSSIDRMVDGLKSLYSDWSLNKDGKLEINSLVYMLFVPKARRHHEPAVPIEVDLLQLAGPVCFQKHFGDDFTKQMANILLPKLLTLAVPDKLSADVEECWRHRVVSYLDKDVIIKTNERKLEGKLMGTAIYNNHGYELRVVGKKPCQIFIGSGDFASRLVDISLTEESNAGTVERSSP